MSRRLPFAVAFVLLAAPAAYAKAPAGGVELCGAGGACASIPVADAEHMPFWYAAPEAAPGAPAPYYVLRFRWTAATPEETLYWIPSRGLFRRVFDYGGVGWFRVDSTAVPQSAAGIAPLAAPTLTAVTVGGRSVRGPATYLRLLAGGRVMSVSPGVAWLRVRLQTAVPSPWSDGSAEVRLSKTGGYVWRDGWVFRIPDRLADRARRGLPLSG